jgi:arsenite methyltransferase
MSTAQINARYGAAAAAATQHTQTNPSHMAIAAAFGYTLSDLTSLPAGANMGLSCGNPLALTSLSPGETLLDFGSGGGLDVFLASRQVGRAIGIDQNPQMLALAERNRVTGGYKNVEFVEASITRIPQLEDGVADVVVSNCVINLVPQGEKGEVFKEMWRLLKTGGRVAVSDLCAKRKLSDMMRKDLGAVVACIGGVAEVVEYEGWLKGAGFREVVIVDAGQDCNQYKRCGGEGASESCCGVGAKGEVPEMGQSVLDADLNEWIGSYKIYAVK